MKITLDPGHGYKYNQGALPAYFEGNRMCALAFMLKDALEAYQDLSITITRQKGLACADAVLAYEKQKSGGKAVNNSQVTICQRAQFGNGSDLFLSLHSNASKASVRGSEIWLAKRDALGQALAGKLVTAIASHFGHNNRGLKYDLDDGKRSYGILHQGSAKVKFLVESGFHSNEEDCNRLMDEGFMESLAELMAKEIAGHYQLVAKDLTKEKPVEEGPRLSADPLHKERKLIAAAPEALDFAQTLSALISAPILLTTTLHDYFRKYDQIIGVGPNRAAFTAYLTHYLDVRDTDGRERKQALMDDFDQRSEAYRI